MVIMYLYAAIACAYACVGLFAYYMLDDDEEINIPLCLTFATMWPIAIPVTFILKAVDAMF